MSRAIDPGTERDYESEVRNFLNNLIPASDGDSTNPVEQESHQVLQEARALVDRLASSGASDEQILSELHAWSHARPLPVMDAKKKSEGVAVDRPSTVSDAIERNCTHE